VSAWIPVAERQPSTDYQVFLLYRLIARTIVAERGFYDGKHYYADRNGRKLRPVDATHWQPLPAPPEVAS